jgi:hypothetical protein
MNKIMHHAPTCLTSANEASKHEEITAQISEVRTIYWSSIDPLDRLIVWLIDPIKNSLTAVGTELTSADWQEICSGYKRNIPMLAAVITVNKISTACFTGRLHQSTLPPIVAVTD